MWMMSPSGYEVMTTTSWSVKYCRSFWVAISMAYRSFCIYGVPNLGVSEYFPDEVYGPLDLKVVSWLLPFDDQGGAHNMFACRDVEEEGFSHSRATWIGADVSDTLRLSKAYCASSVQTKVSVFFRSL